MSFSASEWYLIFCEHYWNSEIFADLYISLRLYDCVLRSLYQTFHHAFCNFLFSIWCKRCLFLGVKECVREGCCMISSLCFNNGPCLSSTLSFWVTIPMTAENQSFFFPFALGSCWKWETFIFILFAIIYLSEYLIEASVEVRTSEHMSNYNTLGKSQSCLCEKKVCFTKSLEFSSKQKAKYKILLKVKPKVFCSE